MGFMEGLKEEIYAFQDTEALPLAIRMAGITNPDPTYRIERSKDRNHMFVFEYCMEGRGHITVDGKHFTVQKGDTYILTPNTEQCYFSDKSEPFKKIWVNAESSYLSALLAAHGLSYGVYRYDAMKPMSEILAIAKKNRDCKSASACIAPILLSLIQSLSEKYSGAQGEDLASLVRGHIDASCNTHFSPAALASKLHISLSTMTRAFLCAYAMTPYEYHLKGKERMAKQLLQNTSLSAKEIAFRLGFSDEHYFSNFFKKRTGLRPIEYKEGRFLD